MRLLAYTLLLTLHPPVQHATVLEQRRFQKDLSSCVLRILETTVPSKRAQQSVEVRCDGRLLRSYSFGDGGFTNVFMSVQQPTRIIVNWERGLVSGLTVFAITGGNTRRVDIVFESLTRGGADSLGGGDILLVHVGRRFTDEKTLQPEGTNVYRWNGTAYALTGAFMWHPNATADDRFCVLAKPESCPADRSDKRIPDDYEKL